MFPFALCVFAVISAWGLTASQPLCTWASETGALFDLRPLILTKHQDPNPYNIIADGQDTSFAYAWNFCDVIPASVLPKPCQYMGKTGAVVQYTETSSSDYYCYILGRFNADSDQVSYKLIDASDPAKGLLLTYPAGERCSAISSSTLRSAVIEVQCAAVEQEMVSVSEEEQCLFHIVMKSRHGCPARNATTQ